MIQNEIVAAVLWFLFGSCISAAAFGLVFLIGMFFLWLTKQSWVMGLFLVIAWAAAVSGELFVLVQMWSHIAAAAQLIFTP